MRHGITDKARRAARELLVAADGPIPVDVEQLAVSMGIVIRNDELDHNVSGMLILHNDQSVIVTNNRHHLSRRRFTIAHELGHHMLHRGDQRFFLEGSPVLFRSDDILKSDRRMEQQANAFAAEVLMPTQHVVGEFQRQPCEMEDEEGIRTLADLFGVSPQAMVIRLTELGLDTP